MSRHATFGQMLKATRQRLDLTQAELGRLASIDQSYVSQFERDIGYQRSVRDVVVSLAGALDCDAATTDRLLYAAGLAPVEDWQSRYAEAQAQMAELRDMDQRYRRRYAARLEVAS